MKSIKIIPSFFCAIIALITLSCANENNSSKKYETESLKIESLTNNVFVHTSYLLTQDYGNVGCNGMIYIHDNEALIFDTPTTDSVSLELINWIENELNAKVIGVLATHFHNDCLGGLKSFNEKGVKTYGNNSTIELAKKYGDELPLLGFENEFVIPIGDSYVIINHFGEGHTLDNVVAYVETENVLFGGCLIKKVGANKGYLGDANVAAWSKTVQKIKSAYPNLEHVIPGHGPHGGIELLDYTIDLFKVK